MAITVNSGSSVVAALNGSAAGNAASSQGDTSLFAALFANPLLGLGLDAEGLAGQLPVATDVPLSTLLAQPETPLQTTLAALLQSNQAPTGEAANSNPRLAAEDTSTTADTVSAVLAQLGLETKAVAEESRPSLKASTEEGRISDGRELQGLLNPHQPAPPTVTPSRPPLENTVQSSNPEAAKSAALNTLSAANEAPETEIAAAIEAPTLDTGFAQSLNAAKNHAVQQNAPAHEISHTIQAPVDDKTAWPKQLGDRVVWMTAQGQQTAEIHLNPPQLGPMQISLSIQGDQTTATFVSAHAEVRQAIQDAMPQLRDALASAGISLGQANVNAQTQQQQQAQQNPSQHPRFTRDDAILSGDTATAVVAQTVTPLRNGNGRVDLFA